MSMSVQTFELYTLALLVISFVSVLVILVDRLSMGAGFAEVWQEIAAMAGMLTYIITIIRDRGIGP